MRPSTKLSSQLPFLIKVSAIAVLLWATFHYTAKSQAPSPQTGMALKPVKSGYAPVNGLKLYYEIYGKGEPLVLLHGGLGVIGMYGPVLQELASKRQVIAVELQGHGHTADIDRSLAYESMADDIAALVKYLGSPGCCRGAFFGGAHAENELTRVTEERTVGLGRPVP